MWNQFIENYTYSICAGNRITEKCTTLHNKSNPCLKQYKGHCRKQRFFWTNISLTPHIFLLSSATKSKHPVGCVTFWGRTTGQTCAGNPFDSDQQKALYSAAAPASGFQALQAWSPPARSTAADSHKSSTLQRLHLFQCFIHSGVD